MSASQAARVIWILCGHSADPRTVASIVGKVSRGERI